MLAGDCCLDAEEPFGSEKVAGKTLWARKVWLRGPWAKQVGLKEPLARRSLVTKALGSDKLG